MHIVVEGRTVKVSPARAIGKGGEADVYDVGGGVALKLFKGPGHPDLAGQREQQEAARRRLDEHQHKLRAFPSGLPSRVVRPIALATGPDGRVVGYTMTLLRGTQELMRYGDPGFRRAGVDPQQVVAILRDLHASVAALHAAGVVVGDFNDLNVLVQDEAAWLVDADSFQFGRWVCRAYTERFVDPLLCDPQAARPELQSPHTADSDWYAFSVMALRSLLQVDPYGGVFRPRDPARRVAPAARPLRRITVFDPEVVYPRAAQRPEILPDDLLHHVHAVLERDARGQFPCPLLESLRFTRCTGCGAEHARAACPACTVAPAAVKETVAVRGDVEARTVLRTRGTILAASIGDGGGLRWLVEEDGGLRREDGSVVLAGSAPPGLRIRMTADATLLGLDHVVMMLTPGRAPERLTVDACGRRAAFDATDRHVYHVADGRLFRSGPLGPERIGDVLAGQTMFWVGRRFGLGFYRAGDVAVGFVFDAARQGINDGVDLPRLRGQLVDATCVFADDMAWLFTACAEGGRTVHRCAMVRSGGQVMAAAEAEANDGSWLSHVRGACAAGHALFMPTDRGVVRVEEAGGRLVETRVFVDTEPFVEAGTKLLAGPDRLFAVSRGQVCCLLFSGERRTS